VKHKAGGERPNETLTAIPGVRVGHWTDREAATGCTVVLFPEEGAVAGVDIRGGAPGARGAEPLRPGRLVPRIHALVFAGGSAFGLDAVGGAMRFLRERGVGLEIAGVRVPIVPGFNLFDLGVGRADRWPDADAGYRACQAATADPVEPGSVGAGTGATVGKVLGVEHATKGGLGSALCAQGCWLVGALAVVNAFGDVLDPATGRIVAGARRPDGRGFLNTGELLTRGPLPERFRAAPGAGENTTLGVVVTNAALTKEEALTVARAAQSGLARVIAPVHTLGDGDAVVAASCGEERAHPLVIGQMAAQALQDAVLRAVRQAEGLGGVPAARELLGT